MDEIINPDRLVSIPFRETVRIMEKSSPKGFAMVIALRSTSPSGIRNLSNTLGLSKE